MSPQQPVPSTRELVHYTWHDNVCPEGPRCRARDLHARSTYTYLTPLDAIAEAIDARDDARYDARYADLLPQPQSVETG